MSANCDKEPLLHLAKIERRFVVGDDGAVILKRIDLQIRRGELVAITDQSGSGKSTLMNILGCLDRQSSGSYRIVGQEVGSLNVDQLALLRLEHFGFIFQRYHQPPHLSADENVQIPTVYAGVKTHDRRARTRVAHAFRTSGADQLSVVETIGWPATAALPRQATKRRFSYSQLIKTG